MNKSFKALILITVISSILLLSAGCGSSVNGKYYREFGNYTSTTMYIELKNDRTFQTDGSDPNLSMEGTYEINGSDITFTFMRISSQDPFGAEDTYAGTISGRTLKVGDITYIK